MNLQKLILTENECYKTGQKITPKGIMVHSTGANNPELRRYVGPDDGRLGKNAYGNHWNQLRPDGRKVCVHAFIGKLKDGSVATYQTLPWDHFGWHAAGSANGTHISFEICEDGLTDAVYFGKVYQEAVELCAYLCKLYNLTEKTILCHAEGYKQGIANNHGDVLHWFPKHGKSMDTFRADVKALLDSPEETDELYYVQLGAYRNRAGAETKLAEVKAAGFHEAIISKGKAAAPVQTAATTFQIGDAVKLTSDATQYGKTAKFAAWVYNSTLYVREMNGDRVVVSISKTGAVTGAVNKKHLVRA